MAKAAVQAEVGVPWRMPPVEVGQVVLWYNHRAQKAPTAALVISVGMNSVNLALHSNDIKDHHHKTGVRHRSDPDLGAIVEYESGCWDLMPRDVRLNQVLESLGTSPGT